MRYILIFALLFSSCVFASEEVLEASFGLESSKCPELNSGKHYLTMSKVSACYVGTKPLSNWGTITSVAYLYGAYAIRAYVKGEGDFYISTSAYIRSCPSGTELIDGYCTSKPQENYCDSIQYQLDYDKAKQACDAKATDNQTVKFTASCDRENEVLVQQCEITDKPKPPPEYCPDGSIKPESGICPDTGGGGGTNPPSDLTSVIAAITKGVGAIVEANKADDEMLGVGVAALDKSNDLLKNIKDVTSSLSGEINKVNNSVNQIDDSINNLTRENFNRVINEMDKSFEESKKQTALGTQSLNTQTGIKDSVDELNITIKQNKPDLSKIEGSLNELKSGNTKLLEMLNRPNGNYSQVPFFSQIINSESLTSAINANSQAKYRYGKLIDDFKDSVSIKSDFQNGFITDKGFNLTVNNQRVHVDSGVQKLVDLADVIRPVIIALCSLIAVSIFFRAE